MWNKSIIIVALACQIILRSSVYADPPCAPDNNGAAPAEVATTQQALDHLYDIPQGLISQYMRGVCHTVYPRLRETSPSFQRCITKTDLSVLPLHTARGACLHYVKQFLENTFTGIQFGNNGAARKAGDDLIANGFKERYNSSTGPFPAPDLGEQFQIRVYSGGSAHFKSCGKAPCGHIEICFLGQCASDYHSILPIDAAEAAAGKVKHDHVLEGIYVIDPAKPVSIKSAP